MLLIYGDVFSQTYYVKPAANGGSDTNDGWSVDIAFATIQHFDNIASAGDVGYLLSGTYNESNITFKNSGVTIFGEGLPTIEGSFLTI